MAYSATKSLALSSLLMPLKIEDPFPVLFNASLEFSRSSTAIVLSDSARSHQGDIGFFTLWEGQQF